MVNTVLLFPNGLEKLVKWIQEYFEHPEFVGSMEAALKAFLLFFLLPDW